MDNRSKDRPKPEPPLTIINHITNTTYQRREYLGRGGFARCWEVFDKNQQKMFAGKVVDKSSLVRASQKQKMKQEIMIHRDLSHDNIVQFHATFEDDKFIYIIIELCSRRSLMELHKRRKTVTEPEARYFSKQIATGCKYLHDRNVIHRDLKLANLFLNEDLVVKIGDFGLATLVKQDEKKETLCGTPNYIAPEILLKSGHSYEVDSWSLGCILYTLLVGRPPFETKDLEKTYQLIKSNQYRMPPNLGYDAAKVIKALLSGEPSKRPTMQQFLNSDFLRSFTPTSLPISCLTTTPRFDHVPMDRSMRTPLNPNNRLEQGAQVSSGGELAKEGPAQNYLENFAKIEHMLVGFSNESKVLSDAHSYQMDNAERPESCPIYWVSRWVDYSDKYGMGYELCDNSYGVLFNDVTRLLQTADGDNLQYINTASKEELYTISSYPATLKKKVDLLINFKNYMQENLCKAGENVLRKECDAMARLPFLVAWMRTGSAILLYLSNGTLQMNFFSDHVKIILCPLMKAVSVINEQQKFRTYDISQLLNSGYSSDMHRRIKYCLETMGQLKTNENMFRQPNNENRKKVHS
ncbi:Serine/threonine-protein kinase plk1 [Cichlidogyrus casuarinus]|uniref:Serine/threonine-protein kinase PLK n=1 Tax=Cichlidogyrus casuarinus TaxID=1844966 RepID=A0ABD2PX38_9PLAT